MNHADVKNKLADYLEGDLALDTRARVDAHLDACTDCSREVEEMQQTIRLLRMLPEPELPPAIAANVMRRIRAGETQPGLLERIGRVVSSVLEPTFVLPASAVAIAALVMLVVQEPALLTGLSGWSLDGSAGRRAAVMDEARRSPPQAGPFERRGPPLAAGALETGEGLVFGAPAAQGFGIESTREQRLAGRAAPGPTATTGIRIELGRAPGPGPWRMSELMRSQRRAGGPAGAHSAAPPLAEAIPVAQPTRAPGAGIWRTGPRVLQSADPGSTGGPSASGDLRDEYLARGLRDPVGFAAFLTAQSLAEQEIWVSRLAARAEARGLLDEFVDGLRGSGDADAVRVGNEFAAEARDLRATAAARSETSPTAP